MAVRTRNLRLSARRARNAKPLVAVAMASPSGPDLGILDGIRASAKNWDLVVLSGGYETPLRRLAESGELAGAIGDFVSDAWVHELHERGVRIVQLAQGSKLKSVPNLGPDYEAIGLDAFTSVLRGGSVEMGIVAVTGQYASDRMVRGVQSHPKREGFLIRQTNAATLPLLQSWLSGMTRPCGVLAASDRLARMVIMAAGNLGWKVPGDVAVFGIGNQRMESVFAGMPISSYELPDRAIGRAAAEVMEQMLLGRSRRVRDRVFSARLIERESSLRLPHGVPRAVAYVEARFAEPLQVDDLAQAAGMSRRALELAMQAANGISPAAMIAAVRCREAKLLLKSGDLPIETVGAMCGYPEPERFSAAFKRWTGLSPRDYRQSATRNPKRKPKTRPAERSG